MRSALQSRSTLTVEERIAKQRLLVRDAVALSSLLTIVFALSFVTYLLFHSFAGHRLKLEQRWRTRGEAALTNGQPAKAIDSLRSALAYAPDDRTLQSELATALAGAGQLQEAAVYFNTLHETQPGDGMINLQLARLAVRQGNAAQAIDSYQAALDGTWNGDGVVRRRDVRLELSRFLIEQHRDDEARNQLLIAAGNAADNHQLQLTVAGLLEQADGEQDAFDLYRKAAQFRATRAAGLIGEGRTAAAQGRYLLARNVLTLATGQPDYSHLAAEEQAEVHSMIDQANALLLLYPAENLPSRSRALRAAHAVELAQARLAACAGPLPSPAASAAPAAATAPAASAASEKAAASEETAAPAATISQVKPPVPPTTTTVAASPATAADSRARAGGALRSALGAVQRAGESMAAVTRGVAAAPVGPAAVESSAGAHATLAALADRWRALPQGPPLERQLENDPGLLDQAMALVYETEMTTAQLCGAPGGEDALLLRIAQAPDEVERQ